MKFNEYDFKGIKDSLKEKNSRFILYDRFTNLNGIKFGIFAGKPTNYDHGNQNSITFGAIPKYYPSDIRELPQFTFTFGFTLTYGSTANILEKDEIPFLIRYGLFEFKKWLNEVSDYISMSNKMILSMGEENYFPEVVNNKIIQPRNYEEDKRLENIAEEKILQFFRDNAGRGIIDKELLKDICFVPLDNFQTVFSYLKETGYINIDNGSLTSQGYAYYKNKSNTFSKLNQYSKTVFVAIAFNKEMKDLYDKIYSPLIKDKFNLNPILMTNEDPEEPVDIEILNQINLSKFVICDLTFARQSVYFEAGYAIAKGIKVIFTCRSDHNSDHKTFDSDKFKVHFDIRNRQITWWENEKFDTFKEELNQRIKNYIERNLNNP